MNKTFFMILEMDISAEWKQTSWIATKNMNNLVLGFI